MKTLNEELLSELIAIEQEEIQIGSGFHSFNFSPNEDDSLKK